MIRLATENDIDGITEIFNHAIEARFQTGFTESVDRTERANWLANHDSERFPVFVWEGDNGVQGWASVSPYRSGRAALRHSVEISYFVHRDQQGKGIGTGLLKAVLEAAGDRGYRVAIAIILDKNIASVKLVERAGFSFCGRLPQVAEFDGIVCDHLYYGKVLSGVDQASASLPSPVA